MEQIRLKIYYNYIIDSDKNFILTVIQGIRNCVATGKSALEIGCFLFRLKSTQKYITFHNMI